MTNSLQRLKEGLQFAALVATWLAARVVLKRIEGSRPPGAGRARLLLSCDPFTLVGSRGDAAMLQATVESVVGDLRVAVHGLKAKQIAHAMGLVTEQLAFDWLLPFRLARLLRRLAPVQVLVMGADVMDGHYSAVYSIRLLIGADLAARAGADARFLGFSLNDRIHPAVAWAFRRLSSDVRVQLRDPVSLERFERLGTACQARLVADSAFLLRPTSIVGDGVSQGENELRRAVDWVGEQRRLGRLVIGVNLHGMLFTGARRQEQLHTLLSNVASAMQGAMDVQAVSWVLIPHDDREKAGDLAATAALRAMLGDSVLAHTLVLTAAPPAADAKALAGQLDGVITARMHLAIATLGMGRPVLVLTYQSKFEGLLRHFSLSDEWKLEAAQTQDATAVHNAILRFVSQTEPLARQVASRLPAVQALAAATFE